jgi:ABC-2 type transport system ATP-binding protein
MTREPDQGLGRPFPQSPRPMTNLAIRVRDLKKEYPGRDGVVQAVNGLDLDVEVGECFGLLGPNGAGKTTTVEILEGINQPTSGEVEILGQSWQTDSAAIRERIGVTLQETRFQEKSTVLELAELFRSFYHHGLEPMAALERVSLEGKAKTYVETLSGGQRQRLAVAIALVGDPELLFLDEPTTGLDPQSRRQLQDVILALRAQNRTILLTTHYMEEAEKLCNRVAIIDQGKVIALGSPADLIARLGGDHIVEFALLGQPVAVAEEFLGLESVQSARNETDGFALTVAAPHRAIPALLDFLESTGRHLARLTTRQVSLEDVFVTLTGRHLRDDEAGEAPTEETGRGRRRRGR